MLLTPSTEPLTGPRARLSVTFISAARPEATVHRGPRGPGLGPAEGGARAPRMHFLAGPQPSPKMGPRTVVLGCHPGAGVLVPGISSLGGVLLQEGKANVCKQ